MANTVNISAFPFNSINNDRTYNADDWTKYFSQFIGNGVFMNPSSSLQVVSSTGMKVTVKKGACFINGVMGFVNADTQLDVAVGDGTYPRYDRVVARLNANTRTVSIVAVSGTPGSNPPPPGMVRNGTIYDLVLCNIWVKKGATSITQSVITDTRLHKGVCGMVSGLIEQVDTTTFFDQISSYISEKQSVLEDEWNIWVQANKDLANGGNLTSITAELADAREGSTSIKKNLNDFYTKKGEYGLGGSIPTFPAGIPDTGMYSYNGRHLIQMKDGTTQTRFGVRTTGNMKAVVMKKVNNTNTYVDILDEEDNLKIAWEDTEKSLKDINGNIIAEDSVILLANGLKIITGWCYVSRANNYVRDYELYEPQQCFSKIIVPTVTCVGNANPTLQFQPYRDKTTNKWKVRVVAMDTSQDVFNVTFILLVV